MASYPLHGMLEQETRAGAVSNIVHTESVVTESVVLSQPLPTTDAQGASIVSKAGDAGAITVIQAGEFEIFSGYSYRAVSIGGPIDDEGASGSRDPNSISFYVDPDFTADAPVSGGQLAMIISPGYVGITGYINLGTIAAPAAPANGDMWFDGTALKVRIGGATKTVTVT
jgi:hypothetical protein